MWVGLAKPIPITFSWWLFFTLRLSKQEFAELCGVYIHKSIYNSIHCWVQTKNDPAKNKSYFAPFLLSCLLFHWTTTQNKPKKCDFFVLFSGADNSIFVIIFWTILMNQLLAELDTSNMASGILKVEFKVRMQFSKRIVWHITIFLTSNMEQLLYAMDLFTHLFIQNKDLQLSYNWA